MRVERAGSRDVRSWLDLAADVESLFGAMLDDPGFCQALLKNIGRGTAFCVREGDGRPGTALAGRVLFSPQHPDRPEHRIGWLAVASKRRRRGIGTLLVEHAAGLLPPPAALSVITFGEEIKAGRAARRFYERLGFDPAEPAPGGPEGGTRQVYRRRAAAMSPCRKGC
jgi:GNAT superfamily N-acetyltransferase